MIIFIMVIALTITLMFCSILKTNIMKKNKVLIFCVYLLCPFFVSCDGCQSQEEKERQYRIENERIEREAREREAKEKEYLHQKAEMRFSKMAKQYILDSLFLGMNEDLYYKEINKIRNKYGDSIKIGDLNFSYYGLFENKKLYKFVLSHSLGDVNINEINRDGAYNAIGECDGICRRYIEKYGWPQIETRKNVTYERGNYNLYTSGKWIFNKRNIYVYLNCYEVSREQKRSVFAWFKYHYWINIEHQDPVVTQTIERRNDSIRTIKERNKKKIEAEKQRNIDNL